MKKKPQEHKVTLKKYNKKPMLSPSIPEAPLGRNGTDAETSHRCPKCQGFLVFQPPDATHMVETKCVNCGWQPRWGTRIITESEESRNFRQLTTQLFSELPWNGYSRYRRDFVPGTTASNFPKER